jgi:hypothetical protein
MIPILPGWLMAAVTVALMAGSGLAGYRYAAAKGEAAVSQCQREAAEAQRHAALEAAALKTRSEQAQAEAAALLARREAAFQRRLKEVKSEIYRLSDGRECLSVPLRMRINAALAGDRLPQGAAAAAPAPAGAAADPGGSSDAAVGQWILDAAQLYEQCRARIDAIRQWDEQVASPLPLGEGPGVRAGEGQGEMAHGR